MYCKLLTNGKQLPAFPLEPVRGSIPGLRGEGRECYHSATVAPKTNIIADMLSRIPPRKEAEKIAVIDSGHCRVVNTANSDSDIDNPEEEPFNKSLAQTIQKTQYEDHTMTEIVELLKEESDIIFRMAYCIISLNVSKMTSIKECSL